VRGLSVFLGLSNFSCVCGFREVFLRGIALTTVVRDWSFKLRK